MKEDLALKSYGFTNLDRDEMALVNGGGVVAAVFAAGFILGVAPVYVVAGAAALVVGVGVGIYAAVK